MIYSRPVNYTTVAVTSGSAVKLLSARAGGTLGLRGNNPAAAGNLLVKIVGPNDAAPAASAMTAGLWDYKVAPGATWFDETRVGLAYAIYDSGAGTSVMIEELVVDEKLFAQSTVNTMSAY